ncbi:PQQ-dependent sugar dehydrogenase [Corallococcus macrosporus]|uniref:PQQ-dependent sugar dehydrogenase n=1 Tax=Corallococcus macrosporus TaxID=35 RepID=A0ABS3D8E5_9BACT|nr:PQQ-dependent sugar dehydrogenase [Corallococcus macrosporus]MBN8226600.1 PQQ-dependent sugar dehydrogenase [Corallococcus macrosporus]
MPSPRRCPPCLVVLLALCLGGGSLAGAQPLAPLTLPEGFSSEPVVTGLQYPTTFANLPDGSLLIAEKEGVVRRFKDGVLQPVPFIDIRGRVNSHHDRGLLGLAVDPAFATNGFVYLLYTYDDDDTDDAGPKTARLARYTAVGDMASPTSELVLLGTAVGASCNDLPLGADCIPSDSASHSVGTVRFAPDGTLFVTTGDAASFDAVDDDALRAQSLDSLAGKVLHITRTGAGVGSNPFWNGDAGANRSKVWALGLRNPYRFSLRPGTSMPYLGDVGWNTYEEINVAAPGANLGWPCYEGNFRQRGYESKSVCQALYARGPGAVRPPLYVWDHGVGQTATGGGFYTGMAYPEAWRGAYFFGDYSQQWIRTLRVDANDQLVPDSVTVFATGVGGLVELGFGPDSNLFFVDVVAGELRRIRYTAGNTPPVAVASSTPRRGQPPLLVRFSSAGSSDPDGDALQYRWDFGDNSPVSTLPSPEHTYTTAGFYVARLTVSDGRGGSHSAAVSTVVGNVLPVVTIQSPPPTYRFKVGDVVTYSGSAVDPNEGPIPGDRLRWTVTLRHCTAGGCHTHPYSTSTGVTGSFTVPDHGDEVHFDLKLTAMSSTGLTSSWMITVDPLLVQLTLQTSPPGLELVFDGTSAPAPRVLPVIVGSTHTLRAPSPQGVFGFREWSDGGAAEHVIQVGPDGASYTAFFDPVAPLECPPGQYRAEYFGNRDLEGSPARVRCESAPLENFWGTGSPVPEVGPDDFSVRWTGRFYFVSDLYYFIAQADDGVRVFVDGSRVIDGWKDQSTTSYFVGRWMTAGEHSVVMEYYEHGGDAVAGLRWYR